MEEQSIRLDGYSNMLNKYGTKADNSTAYQFKAETLTDDVQLTELYIANGIFTNIIDKPSDESVKHGIDIDFGNDEISEYVEERLDELDYEDKFAQAQKYARLYGGAIIVLIVNDGKGLEEPLDINNVKSIDEMRVFERAIVQPDYMSMNAVGLQQEIGYGEPRGYTVSSIYGHFYVHRSRCLVFKNGKMPEKALHQDYRYWGVPEYERLKTELRQCITSHGYGTRLLERAVQAIYKMKNLANMLATDDGENKALKRIELIDLARGIFNSIAIDSDGEDYDFKTTNLSGVKDILDATCTMLSAVTNIPQTILFGRSPAGQNATGDADLENYYNMVQSFQKRNMKKSTRTLIDIILQQGMCEGIISEMPRYKVKFAPLWSMSEREKAEVEKIKADTDKTKADTACAYVLNGILDPTDVRNALARDGEFSIDEIVSEDGELDTDKIYDAIHIEMPDTSEPKPTEQIKEDEEDIDKGVGVLIVRDGTLLVADRLDGTGICGAGGHIEQGEDTITASIRETEEEFGITPKDLTLLGVLPKTDDYLESTVYITDKFDGIPKADGTEMTNAMWMTLEELTQCNLFKAFEDSIQLLISKLSNTS